MRGVRRPNRWWVVPGLVAALALTGCALGASLPGALLAVLLLLAGAAACGSRSLGNEDDGGAGVDARPSVDARPTPDAAVVACGQGVCEEGLACVVTPERGPWCLPDTDGDGIADEVDNCPYADNPDQTDSDGDGMGDACDLCEGPNDTTSCGPSCCNDPDGDGVPGEGSFGYYPEGPDNCPFLDNPDQTDTDGDGVGDACDLFPYDPNPLTPCGDPGLDSDGDGLPDGDFCAVEDPDPCPLHDSPREADYDGDGVPDVCDPDGVPPLETGFGLREASPRPAKRATPPDAAFREAERQRLLGALAAAGALDAETLRLAGYNDEAA